MQAPLIRWNAKLEQLSSLLAGVAGGSSSHNQPAEEAQQSAGAEEQLVGTPKYPPEPSTHKNYRTHQIGSVWPWVRGCQVKWNEAKCKTRVKTKTNWIELKRERGGAKQLKPNCMQQGPRTTDPPVHVTLHLHIIANCCAACSFAFIAKAIK